MEGSLLHLQQTIGNQAVLRQVRAGALQRRPSRPQGSRSASGPAVLGFLSRAPSGDSFVAGGGEPMVRLGSSSPAVAVLQQYLAAAGVQVGADGIFGPQTHDAVVAFQRAAGLTPDGVVGPLTWRSLKAPGGSAPRGPEAQPAGASLSPAIAAKLREIKGLLRALGGGGTSTADTTAADTGEGAAPAAARSEGWLDDAEATVSNGVSWVEEQAGAAEAWAEEKAGQVGAWVEEKAATAWDSAEQAASGAGAWVEEQAGAAWESVEHAADEVQEIAVGIGEDLAQAGAGLRERFGKELAVLEETVRDLGRPLGLSPEEVGALGEKLDGVLATLREQIAGVTNQQQQMPAAGAAADRGSTTFTLSNVGDSFMADTLAEASARFQGREAGSVIARPSWPKAQFDTATGRVIRAWFDVPITKTMPYWTNVEERCQAVQDEWQRFRVVLEAHENHHLASWLVMAKDAHLKVIGQPHEQVDVIFNALIAEINKANAEYDAQSQHGQAQSGFSRGTIIDTRITC